MSPSKKPASSKFTANNTKLTNLVLSQVLKSIPLLEQLDAGGAVGCGGGVGLGAGGLGGFPKQP